MHRALHLAILLAACAPECPDGKGRTAGGACAALAFSSDFPRGPGQGLTADGSCGELAFETDEVTSDPASQPTDTTPTTDTRGTIPTTPLVVEGDVVVGVAPVGLAAERVVAMLEAHEIDLPVAHVSSDHPWVGLGGPRVPVAIAAVHGRVLWRGYPELVHEAMVMRWLTRSERGEATPESR